MFSRIVLLLVLTLAVPVLGQEPPLARDVRTVPGAKPTPWLQYTDPAAMSVEVSGTWDQWTVRTPMARSNTIWVLDVRKLPVKPGRYEFKFIVNGTWEPGDNRVVHINDDKMLERPSDIILSATLDAPDEIMVYLRRSIADPSSVKIRLEPDWPIKDIKVASGQTEGIAQGFVMAGSLVTFFFDEKLYGMRLAPTARVSVAGNFNAWDGSGGRQNQWVLRDENDDGVWELTCPREGLRPPAGERDLLFKFVVNGSQWLSPPAHAVNAVPDGQGNTNLRLDPSGPGSTMLKVITAQPLPLSQNFTLVADGLANRRVRHMISPGKIFDALKSDKELGVILNKAQGATTYRIFAPRASSVHLCIFKTPEYAVQKPSYQRLQPAERYPLWKDESDGVWEVSLLGLDVGKYYSFNVDGPAGDGEGFMAIAQVGDPYARAAAHAHNNTIVIDPEATNEWFSGWTDQDYKTPDHRDMVIYETHVRNFTIHPSSMVPAHLRGTYQGMLATLGTGTGLDHLKDMGVNMIELMPVAEFENGVREYNWGYNTVFFFAPEASYGRAPLKGSQYYEFKRLVDGLHRAGFGVILDVVYNHVGGPNIFSLIDRKYYFRLTPEYYFQNFSGVGNDVKSESPMMRRFIVDNIVYWMKEHHVDGFRFDLAELIDMETMLAVRDAAKKVNPNVILISEPWSLRGENKRELRGTGWAAWNNDYRYVAKDFVRGRANRDWLKKQLTGSGEVWTANPLQTVNYLESHDDMALADELCLRPDKDGRNLQPYDISMNRLAATLLFTSLGIPMLSEGQEFLRSKYGLNNTYDKGDAVNALRWADRERPLAAEAMAYYKGLIQMRQSQQGRAFRVAKQPPASYYQWIMPANEKTIGYVVNAPRIHPGNGFIVLANADDSPHEFRVPFPAGRWRVIANGQVVDMKGLPKYDVMTGPTTFAVKVPAMSSFILMDGF